MIIKFAKVILNVWIFMVVYHETDDHFILEKELAEQFWSMTDYVFMSMSFIKLPTGFVQVSESESLFSFGFVLKL